MAADRQGRILVWLLVLLCLALFVGGLGVLLRPLSRKAREEGCTANLKQIWAGLEAYRSDFGTRPPWLSNLYPKYVADAETFVCPADRSKGLDGSTPAWWPFQRFPETWDNRGRPADRENCWVIYGQPPKADPGDLRNPQIEACSYLYEFSIAYCSWWSEGGYPDPVKHGGNGDGVVSWREVKTLVEGKGLQPDGTFDGDEAHLGLVPIVRCFHHHYNPKSIRPGVVLNLASGTGKVFYSPGSSD